MNLSLPVSKGDMWVYQDPPANSRRDWYSLEAWDTEARLSLLPCSSSFHSPWASHRMLYRGPPWWSRCECQTKRADGAGLFSMHSNGDWWQQERAVQASYR